MTPTPDGGSVLVDLHGGNLFALNMTATVLLISLTDPADKAATVAVEELARADYERAIEWSDRLSGDLLRRGLLQEAT
jgi:hypothetical protein